MTRDRTSLIFRGQDDGLGQQFPGSCFDGIAAVPLRQESKKCVIRRRLFLAAAHADAVLIVMAEGVDSLRFPLSAPAGTFPHAAFGAGRLCHRDPFAELVFVAARGKRSRHAEDGACRNDGNDFLLHIPLPRRKCRFSILYHAQPRLTSPR